MFECKCGAFINESEIEKHVKGCHFWGDEKN